MTTEAIENKVIEIAADELGVEPSELASDTRLDSIFADSLEYVSFTLRLGELGSLSEESISKAETIGDLVYALVLPN